MPREIVRANRRGAATEEARAAAFIMQRLAFEFEFNVLNPNLIGSSVRCAYHLVIRSTSSGRGYPAYHNGATDMGIEGQFAGLAIRTRREEVLSRDLRGDLSDVA